MSIKIIYDGNRISYVLSKAAQNNSKKALYYRAKYPSQVKAMTKKGWYVTKKIASGKPLNLKLIKKIASFIRHKSNSKIANKYKKTPWKDRGYVAWLGWGGTEGIQDSRKILKLVKLRR